MFGKVRFHPRHGSCYKYARTDNICPIGRRFRFAIHAARRTLPQHCRQTPWEEGNVAVGVSLLTILLHSWRSLSNLWLVLYPGSRGVSQVCRIFAPKKQNASRQPLVLGMFPQCPWAYVFSSSRRPSSGLRHSQLRSPQQTHPVGICTIIFAQPSPCPG